MSQALYRKYRSKSLEEIVGQEHITDTLKKALETGRLSHAYLFTGPRGVGKTSIARILAHEINALPYTEGETHIDIIEIDAASNNGVEDVRDLREKAYIAPTTGKYKVYIIDEVHMLSKAAFNALLKILEEPPTHVVFILATTEVHKLPETIISRTQRYIFRPVDKAKVVEHLAYIAKQEAIDIDHEALELIAEHGEGSFRDSISLLDQVSNVSAGRIDLTTLQSLLGTPPLEATTALVAAMQQHDVVTLMQQLDSLLGQGFQAASIAKQISALLRQGLLDNKPALPSLETLALLERLLDVPTAHDPARFLEICLLGVTADSSSQTIQTLQPATKPESPKPPAVTTPKAEPKKAPPAAEANAAPVAQTVTATITNDSTKQDIAACTTVTRVEKAPEPTLSPEDAKTVEVSVSGKLDAECWPAVLTALKKKYNTLYGVVKTAQPNFDKDGKLELTFAFAFHQKRINDAKNKKIVADTIEQVTGQLVEISCLFDKNIAVRTYSGLPDLPPEGGEVIHAIGTGAKDDTTINAVSTIFGGGEILS